MAERTAAGRAGQSSSGMGKVSNPVRPGLTDETKRGAIICAVLCCASTALSALEFYFILL